MENLYKGKQREETQALASGPRYGCPVNSRYFSLITRFLLLQGLQLSD